MGSQIYWTYLHRANKALDVFTTSTTGSPLSVMLKIISLDPFHKGQKGVMFVGSCLMFGLSDITRSAKDWEKALSKSGLAKGGRCPL